jgi:hypothetical protein
VAGALGIFFAKGGAANLFRCVLVKKAHNALS